MTGISRDDWLQAVADAGVEAEENSDAVTMAEFAALIGAKRDTARMRMLALIQAGKVEATTKRKRNTRGALISLPAYRLRKEP